MAGAFRRAFSLPVRRGALGEAPASGDRAPSALIRDQRFP